MNRSPMSIAQRLSKAQGRGPLRNLALRLCEINHYMREHIMFIITGRVPVIPVLSQFNFLMQQQQR